MIRNSAGERDEVLAFDIIWSLGNVGRRYCRGCFVANLATDRSRGVVGRRRNSVGKLFSRGEGVEAQNGHRRNDRDDRHDLHDRHTESRGYLRWPGESHLVPPHNFRAKTKSAQIAALLFEEYLNRRR